MHDRVPRWREHHSREYLSSHLCPFLCYNIMFPLPRNALERSSAQMLSLITGFFPPKCFLVFIIIEAGGGGVECVAGCIGILRVGNITPVS